MQYEYNLLWNAFNTMFKKKSCCCPVALEVSFLFCTSKRQSFILPQCEDSSSGNEPTKASVTDLNHVT